MDTDRHAAPLGKTPLSFRHARPWREEKAPYGGPGIVELGLGVLEAVAVERLAEEKQAS